MECKLCGDEIGDRSWNIQGLSVHNRLMNLLNIDDICEDCEHECLKVLMCWIEMKKREKTTRKELENIK